eukprot:352616-Chlamydomonas_euryale.AAC.16
MESLSILLGCCSGIFGSMCGGWEQVGTWRGGYMERWFISTAEHKAGFHLLNRLQKGNTLRPALPALPALVLPVPLACIPPTQLPHAPMHAPNVTLNIEASQPSRCPTPFSEGRRQECSSPTPRTPPGMRAIARYGGDRAHTHLSRRVANDTRGVWAGQAEPASAIVARGNPRPLTRTRRRCRHRRCHRCGRLELRNRVVGRQRRRVILVAAAATVAAAAARGRSVIEHACAIAAGRVFRRKAKRAHRRVTNGSGATRSRRAVGATRIGSASAQPGRHCAAIVGAEGGQAAAAAACSVRNGACVVVSTPQRLRPSRQVGGAAPQQRRRRRMAQHIGGPRGPRRAAGGAWLTHRRQVAAAGRAAAQTPRRHVKVARVAA